MKRARPEESAAQNAAQSAAKPATPSASKRGATRAAKRADAALTVRRVCVLGDAHKPDVKQLLREMRAWLVARDCAVDVSEDVRAWCEAHAELGPRARASGRADLYVVLGGDGAILAVARALRDEPVPILGVNFGRVGFLAATPATRWQESLEAVLSGASLPEPRMRLEAEIGGIDGKARAVALNEVVLQRGAHQSMLTIALSVGGAWVTNYRADGLIVATPSGSTAYSLSAGGPILAPAMQGVVVTPICPQGLSNRPLVLASESELELVLTHAHGLTTLVVDGQSFFQMRPGDSVRIRRHPVAYPLLAMPGLDPYRRLRERLGWRGSIEEQEFAAPPKRAPRRDSGVDSL